MIHADATIVLDDKRPSETSINRMLDTLHASLAALEAGSLDARMTACLIDTMPGFVRAFDRERRLYNARRKAGDKGVLDNYLQVLTLPIVNMICSIAITLAPNDENVRGMLVAHIFDNLFRGVSSQMSEGASHGRGH